ncbi:hypothetical protein [Arthrobacter sp. SLBN-53]|uniref:methyltransferase family protein n=1 Tax=Arthrobacter sp. SLBN-53 TaxID=2768412 RepID=UPI0011545953|nr:hypothetical protein [Arthrobacter sp. SLBN-53]TQK28505.1 phospholipid methyltransferase [Arthrobacter sp. SLBN-53]
MRVPPVGVAGAAALAQIWLSRGASGSTASRLVAGGAAALSVGVLLASVGSFRRHDTSVNPLEVDRAATLVRTGIFRAFRNPMYLGMAGPLVAQAIQRTGLGIDAARSTLCGGGAAGPDPDRVPSRPLADRNVPLTAP